MSPSQKDDDGQEWFAGDSAGLDADYSFVVRCVTRVPDKYNYGDDGDSEPVAVAQSQEYRDRIVADHRDVRQLRDELARESAEWRKAFIEQAKAQVAAEDVLRERVRVLEEALRKIQVFDHSSVDCQGPSGQALCKAHMHQTFDIVDAALLDPAAATEGGEGA